LKYDELCYFNYFNNYKFLHLETCFYEIGPEHQNTSIKIDRLEFYWISFIGRKAFSEI